MLYSHSRFSWEPSEIGAAKPDGARLLREAPAAFGRLCVETVLLRLAGVARVFHQPPSGGCVLKLRQRRIKVNRLGPAAFGRLCVETFAAPVRAEVGLPPAAFGRLCVETSTCQKFRSGKKPAAFGRLCVETKVPKIPISKVFGQPPSGGCVLKRLVSTKSAS